MAFLGATMGIFNHHISIGVFDNIYVFGAFSIFDCVINDSKQWAAMKREQCGE